MDIRFPDHAHCGALTRVLTGSYPGVPTRPPRRVRAGQALYRQGDPTDELFVVSKGQLQTSVLLPGGREIVTGEFGPGDAISEVCFCEVRARQETAVALEDSTVVPLGPADLVAFAKGGDGPLVEILEMFTHRLVEAESRLSEAHASVRERLVSYLLRSASERTGEAGIWAFAKPVSHEDMARHIGTTREQVSLLLEAFRRDGAVLYDRKTPLRVNREKLGATP